MAGAFQVQGDWDNLTAFQNRSLQQGNKERQLQTIMNAFHIGCIHNPKFAHFWIEIYICVCVFV